MPDLPAPRPDLPPPPPRWPAPTVRELIRTNPEARRRFGRAYAELLAWLLAAVLTITALLLWAYVRRARRLRERLGPPRPVRWPELPDTPPDEPR